MHTCVLRQRVYIGCVIPRGLDLVNVHLFHDASNLVACTASPSVYSHNRRTALRYVIDRSAANQRTRAAFQPPHSLRPRSTQ